MIIRERSLGAAPALLSLLLIGAAGCGPASREDKAAAPAPECTAPLVQTTSGPVCGLERTGWDTGPSGATAHAYLGIRYATARRWERPEAFRSDRPTRATQPGKICPQATRWADAETQDEDCLFLNVWTPATPGPRLRPVMVFLHGGAFVLGAGSGPISDGGNLAARGDVVVVSLNYRLGALGFLAGGRGEDRLEGNYGIRDQQLALAWVRANIRGFGGDPDALTLFGQSAGAMAVGAHLAAPASRAFFRAAIMQSNPYGLPFKSPREAATVRRAFDVATRTCLTGSLACLRELPAARVVEAEGRALARLVPLFLQGWAGLLTWTPIVDGDLIPAQPMAVEITVPVIAGTNADEATLFVGGIRSLADWEYHLALRFLFGARTSTEILEHPRYAGGEGDSALALERVATDYLFTCANRRVLTRAGTPKAFGYEFRHVPSYAVWPPGLPLSSACPPERKKACHTFELPFVFGNAVTVLRPTSRHPFAVQHQFTPAERRLADVVGRYWTAFASREDPNTTGLPPWPRFGPSGARLVLDEAISDTRDATASCAELWDRIGYGLSP